MNKSRFILISISLKKKLSVSETSYLDNVKYSKLYNKILDYMEKKELYCDLGFPISQLATEFNRNISYISRKRPYSKNINFTLFINLYGIDKAKKCWNKSFILNIV